MWLVGTYLNHEIIATLIVEYDKWFFVFVVGGLQVVDAQ
jgi:hypothetical protein